jgi:hypothetical protein
MSLITTPVTLHRKTKVRQHCQWWFAVGLLKRPHGKGTLLAVAPCQAGVTLHNLVFEGDVC